MKSKLNIVYYNSGLDTWLNSIRKDNWHFFKMEPHLRNCAIDGVTETGLFLASTKHNPAKMSFYHSSLIHNKSGNTRFDLEAMVDLNGTLEKCGFDLIDYKPVFHLRLDDGAWRGPPMLGYLCLWEITLDSAKAASIIKKSELILNRMLMDKEGLPESVTTRIEFIDIIKRIITMDKELRSCPDAEAIEVDIDVISSVPTNSKSAPNSLEFIEEVLWHIEGNLIYKNQYKC
jgi:hypothetical protein